MVEGKGFTDFLERGLDLGVNSAQISFLDGVRECKHCQVVGLIGREVLQPGFSKTVRFQPEDEEEFFIIQTESGSREGDQMGQNGDNRVGRQPPGFRKIGEEKRLNNGLKDDFLSPSNVQKTNALGDKSMISNVQSTLTQNSANVSAIIRTEAAEAKIFNSQSELSFLKHNSNILGSHKKIDSGCRKIGTPFGDKSGRDILPNQILRRDSTEKILWGLIGPREVPLITDSLYESFEKDCQMINSLNRRRDLEASKLARKRPNHSKEDRKFSVNQENSHRETAQNKEFGNMYSHKTIPARVSEIVKRSVNIKPSRRRKRIRVKSVRKLESLKGLYKEILLKKLASRRKDWGGRFTPYQVLKEYRSSKSGFGSFSEFLEAYLSLETVGN